MPCKFRKESRFSLEFYRISILELKKYEITSMSNKQINNHRDFQAFLFPHQFQGLSFYIPIKN